MVDIPRSKSVWQRWLRNVVYAGTALMATVLIALGVSRLKPAEPEVQKATVVIDTVKRGLMLCEVRGFGKLVPEQVQWVTTATEGRVERILVEPGTAVRSRTILLELSNPELEREALDSAMMVKAAEADWTSLRVRLEKEVLDQKANLATVQANYSHAVLEAELNEELAKGGLIAAIQLKASQGRAEEFTTRLQIEKERMSISSEAVEAQLAAQTARVDQYRALAQLKQSQLDSLHVRAGTEGVLALMQVEVGQRVTPGTMLARVADPARLKAEIKIPETQAKDIQIGQVASVDTRNGIIAGHVIRIDPAVQAGAVTVDITLDEALPKGARPDLSVDGTIELARLENVLYLGRPAFAQQNSSVGFFRLESGGAKASRVKVRLGQASVNTVEVVDGLNTGDQVILSDMSAWDSFDRVRLN